MAEPIGPKFGEVWRDANGLATVMWVSANETTDGRHLGSVLVLEADEFWGVPGTIETGVSWIYIGWEKVE